MVIEQLLGDLPPSQFVEDYYLKFPFARPYGAREFAHLANWETVRRILASPDPDVILAREGKPWDGTSPSSYDEAKEVYASGYTVVIRHAEQHDDALAQLARGFQEDFQAPVNVHIYCTPARQHGFGWHYDAEDVFVIQTHGSKEYAVRKNTVNPWPTVETIPRNLGFESEIMPLMKCMLRAGDWLYIPAGYWHVGKAGEEAISLAVGVMSTTALDVYDFIRGELLRSLRWRQRLPTPGKASPLEARELFERYQSLFAELADDLAVAMRDEEFVRAWLAMKGRPECGTPEQNNHG